MYLGILASHPVQYQAPWFRTLAQQVDLEVFFAHRQTPKGQADGGFGIAFDWDIDLLSGYKHRFLNNVSRRPGTGHFFGCDNPEIRQIIRWGRASGVPSSLHSPISDLQSKKRFDAFIVSGWQLKCYWQAVRACRRARVPVLVRGDSQLGTPRSPLKRIAKEILYRLLLRQFDGFLVVGQRNREYLKHYGVKDQRMFFAPHFVDNEWFAKEAAKVRGPWSVVRGRGSTAGGQSTGLQDYRTTGPQDQRTKIRIQWGIPGDAFCVLFCGKFIPKKRPLDLVAAAQLLTAENAKNSKDTIKRPIHLLFAGSGELGNQLRGSCRVVFDEEAAVDQSARLYDFSISASQNVSISSLLPSATFAGFLNQSEISKAYVAADCLVLPSDGGETWGLVVNEAMACGLPAVVSDAAGCAPDLIDEGKTGFTFPVGDAAQLANRLALLLEMKQRGHDFRPALAEKMRTYNVASAVNGTLKAVDTLARR